MNKMNLDQQLEIKKDNKSYTLYPTLYSKVLIFNQDREGGEFSMDKLFEIIDKFFRKNF